jgi:ribonuclease HI
VHGGDLTAAYAVLAGADVVEVWTDGSCSPNPGRGGYGIIFEIGHERVEAFGGEPDTTNNRAEMLATIRAIEALPRASRLTLHTDSQYVRDGITSWIHAWKKNGWLTRNGSPVKNSDLWRRLDELTANRSITWRWVRGHANDLNNVAADRLATIGRESSR